MDAETLRSNLSQLLPGSLPSWTQEPIAKTLRLNQLSAVYSLCRPASSPGEFLESAMASLSIRTRISDIDLARLPRKGGTIVIANHPYGLLDGMVLTALLLRIRPDVRVLANEILFSVPEIRPLLLGVDVVGRTGGKAANAGALRAASEFVAAGGMLVVFPAGEVARRRFSSMCSEDGRWNAAVASVVQLAVRRGSKCSVVPCFIPGVNSDVFYAAGLLSTKLQTALLGRELLNKEGKTVSIRVGAAVDAQKLLSIPGAEERTRYLRWRCELLWERQDFDAETSRPLKRRAWEKVGKAATIAAAVAPEVVAEEIAGLPEECLLDRSGKLRVYLADAGLIPNVLLEIGRLREITFRAAGEGTGKPRDLDRFDETYQHLFLWNAERLEIAGAYRLKGTDTIEGEDRRFGLYTGTLFRFGKPFLEQISPALELGRSFVRAEYQRSFNPLLLLWKGIGKVVSRNPRYCVLFGPVSISNQYQAISRDLMVTYLQHRSSLQALLRYVTPRRAFRPSRRGRPIEFVSSAGLEVDDLSDIVSDIERSPVGIPVLLRQYLKLGGKLLGFNVDEAFSNCVDGLILVDLRNTEPRFLERYLGKEEARNFLDFQKGSYDTFEIDHDSELGRARSGRPDPAADIVF